jgi:hypothetical protein
MVKGCHLRWTKSHLDKASDPRPHGLSPYILIVFKGCGFKVGLGNSSGWAIMEFSDEQSN